MPGSPPSSVTEPGTTPPPSTRSSSDTPVERVDQASTSTSVIGTAGDSGAPTAGADASRRSSSRVFQPPQEGHRPAHCTAVPPQSLHRYEVRSFPMPDILAAGCDSPEDPGSGRRSPAPAVSQEDGEPDEE